jgi:TctA family transporter
MITVPKIDRTTRTKHVHMAAKAAGIELVVALVILLAATQAMMNAQKTNTNDKSQAIVMTFLAFVIQQQMRFRKHSVKSGILGIVTDI